MNSEDLKGIALFEGLRARDREDIAARFTVRSFQKGDYVCRQGDPGTSLFLIRRGIGQVTAESADGAVPLSLLRRGDVVGEMSLLTNEPRSASVRVRESMDVLELDQGAFLSMAARYPAILGNLNRILSRRLAQSNRSHLRSTQRGEAVALVVTRATAAMVSDVIESTGRAAPRKVAVMNLLRSDGQPPLGFTEALSPLDDLLATHATVVLVVSGDDPRLGTLVDQVDRTVVLCLSEEAPATRARLEGTASSQEMVLVGDGRGMANGGVVRTINTARWTQSVGWLGRHLARTKLGLALGAGGAKGYAHVGVLGVLEEAGYTVDYVAGSSIGAVVGACLALGMEADDIGQTLRRAFTPEMVAAMFSLSFGGGSAGGDVMNRTWHDLVGGRSFADLEIPLVVMTVDLESRAPATITQGSVHEALVAATALAGFVPPYRRGDQRLVDGVALVPVPTEAVIDAGADVTVSVNLLGHQTLAAWPGEAPASGSLARRHRVLDAMLEVMDLAQQESSARHAAKADVVLEPRFGPATWRDFQLAERFLAAGRAEAQMQLEALHSLARPQSTPPKKEGNVVRRLQFG
ncbi:MAG: hypothetical protein QOH66_2480 [Actinomycetota bacterium]|jgi:NTE family protein|nr:hypothetical protein [Actinomycetota bacterium]